MDVIRKVLALSPLEEVEILQPLSGLDLSRQRLTLRRLAVHTSIRADLPTFPHLQELAITDFVAEAVSWVEEFSPQISRLSLVGDFHAIASVNAAKFTSMEEVLTEMTSYNEFNLMDSKDSDSQSAVTRSARSSYGFESILEVAASASIRFNDTWTNETLEAAVCSYPNTSTNLLISSSGNAIMPLRMPACVKSWTSMTTVSLSFMMLPNFATLPSSVKTLSITNYIGTWTQEEAGTNYDNTPETANNFDWYWILNLPVLNSAVIKPASGHWMNGTLPNHLGHNTLANLDVSGYGFTSLNQLSGTIAPDWFMRFPAMITLNAAYNRLTGTIPYYGVQQVRELSLANNLFTHWPPFIQNSTTNFGPAVDWRLIDIGDNLLVQLPSDDNFKIMSKLTHFYLPNNPGLNGTFPSQLINTLPTRTIALSVISLGGTKLTGPLPPINSDLVPLYNTNVMWFLAPGCNFTGTIPASWSDIPFNWLDLSYNTRLNGTIATISSETGLITSNAIKSVSILQLDETGFVGPMLNISALGNLRTLRATNTKLDFCATARRTAQQTLIFPAPALSSFSCTLSLNNASQCRWAWPSACQIDTYFPPTTSSTPFGCPLPSPGPSFTCSLGSWTAPGSVSQETINIPPGSTTIVYGDLTTENIVISPGSTLSITGCINASSLNVTVVLTEEEIDHIGSGGLSRQIYRQGSAQGTVCNQATNFGVHADTTAVKKCKKVKVDEINNSPSGMTATFIVSTSGCNLWWIILVSVLCGVLLIGIIVVVVIATMSKSAQAKMRPFSQRRTMQGSAARAGSYPEPTGNEEELQPIEPVR